MDIEVAVTAPGRAGGQRGARWWVASHGSKLLYSTICCFVAAASKLAGLTANPFMTLLSGSKSSLQPPSSAANPQSMSRENVFFSHQSGPKPVRFKNLFHPPCETDPGAISRGVDASEASCGVPASGSECRAWATWPAYSVGLTSSGTEQPACKAY